MHLKRYDSLALPFLGSMYFLSSLCFKDPTPMMTLLGFSNVFSKFEVNSCSKHSVSAIKHELQKICFFTPSIIFSQPHASGEEASTAQAKDDEAPAGGRSMPAISNPSVGTMHSNRLEQTSERVRSSEPVRHSHLQMLNFRICRNIDSTRDLAF